MEFLEKLDILSIEKIRQIELCTIGQCCSGQWHLCRRDVITVSKAHEVITRMKKVREGGRGVVNIWSVKEKKFGMTFVNPNIPALKYARDMEIKAVNTFVEYIKNRMWAGSRRNHATIHWSKSRLVNVMFEL